MKTIEKPRAGARPHLRVGFALTAAASVLMTAGTSHAFPPPITATPPVKTEAAAPAADAAEAKRHFEQGVALYNERNYEGALVEFQAARRLSSSSIVLYNIGLTQKGRYRYVEAIESLEAFIAESAQDPKVTTARRREVQQLVAEMKALLGEVRVKADPGAAVISIDGQAVKMIPGAPTIFKLAAGPHVVSAAAPGFVADSRNVTVVAGTAQDLVFTLAAIPTTARVAITTNVQPAAIRIDGHDVGASPLTVVLAAGGHQIEATAERHQAYQSDLMVVAGQDRTFRVTLQPAALNAAFDEDERKPIYKKWWLWAAVGGAVAAGIIIAVATSSTEAPLRGTLSPGAQPTP